MLRWIRLILIAAVIMGGALALMVGTTWGRRQLVFLLDQGYPPNMGPLQAKSDENANGKPLKIKLIPVVDGLNQPVDIQGIPGHPNELVILEKTGTAKRLDLKTGTAQIWFRVSVRDRSEQGLLGLAFHPKFTENGRLFLNYTPKEGAPRTVVAEWKTDAKTLSKPVFDHLILTVEQPYPNHNGGQLQFGPDQKLYVGFGDGGYADDPHQNGQNRQTLLAAMLRLDIDGKPPYIPQDNPFVGQVDARPEIWAYGLRNPWRFSFAPDGRMVVGDVGQNLWEEITLVGAGENHGWGIREAAHCFPPGSTCSKGQMIDPLWSYSRDQGTSITGGYVYTGKEIPALTGKYVCGDFTSGRLWAVDLPPKGQKGPAKQIYTLGRWPISPASFGVGANGVLYVADFGGGRVLRLGL